MTLTTVRCLVRGRVQGVFFRASTQRKARQLNLTGYAKNLSDGRVEVVASGEKMAVDQLVLWLQRGPIGARVDAVLVEAAEDGEGFSGFGTA
jgi:acylphosphatase